MLHPGYHSDGIVPESHRLPFSSGKRPNLFSAAKRPTLWTFHYYRITYLSCQQNNDRIKYIFCLKMLKPRKQTPTIWKSPDFSCTGKTTGLDGRFAPGKAYGCHQFLNWWPQDATGFLHLDGFESRSLHQIKKATPSGGFFYFPEIQGLEPTSMRYAGGISQQPVQKLAVTLWICPQGQIQ